MRTMFNAESEDERRLKFLLSMELNSVLLLDINEALKEKMDQLTDEQKEKLNKQVRYFDETSKIIDDMTQLDNKSHQARLDFLAQRYDEINAFVNRLTNEKVIFIKTNMIRLRDAFIYYLSDPVKKEKYDLSRSENMASLGEWGKMLKMQDIEKDKAQLLKKMDFILGKNPPNNFELLKNMPRDSQKNQQGQPLSHQDSNVIDEVVSEVVRKRQTWNQHVKSRSSGSGAEVSKIMQEFRKSKVSARSAPGSGVSSEVESDSSEKKKFKK